MIQITGFKFAVAAALALLLTTFTVFPGASAAYTARPQPAQAVRQIEQHRQSRKGQPVANLGAPYAYGRPVLWQEPVDIESRDLFYGVGGREGAPDPSAPFTFVRHSKSGTQKKVIVEDNRGRKWTVKFGPEARPETAATRIVWAAGYHVDQDYFVPHARIVGKENIDARDVRFERRDDGYEEVGIWRWKENPFVGTRELDGLKVLMALIKNWDLQSTNNEILTPKKKPGPRIYYVSDLGGSFGQTGTILNSVPLFGGLPPTIGFSGAKAKGDPYAFSGERFVKEVRGGRVYFYSRRSSMRGNLNGVPVATARWMGAMLGRLSDKQLTDAFCAGGFDDAETAIYVRILRARIMQLQRL
ncbi:MAG: hypothetical protein ACREA2_15285 [Blastocatellia bacterium]